MIGPETVGAERQPDRSVPLFTIGTVSRRVGVSPPALRMWEERYGVIQPHRDRHGRRLYSQAQIDDLMWLQDMIARGLTAAEAHRMLETRRTMPLVSSTPDDARVAFRKWVLADHVWLDELCSQTVNGVPGALLGYIGVHDSGTQDPESWLLVSCMKGDRPVWFTGSAHRAARLRGDRLASGQMVSITSGRGEEQVTEQAAPVMLQGEWVATVALVSVGPDGAGREMLEGMHRRVSARHAAWHAYAKLEESTSPSAPARPA